MKNIWLRFNNFKKEFPIGCKVMIRGSIIETVSGYGVVTDATWIFIRTPNGNYYDKAEIVKL